LHDVWPPKLRPNTQRKFAAADTSVAEADDAHIFMSPCLTTWDRCEQNSQAESETTAPGMVHVV
jgi:hypothetical protein